MKSDAKEVLTSTREVSSLECFVLMPISEVDGYPSNHFKHVYQNIISPACSFANVNPIRADDVAATNLIHIDIIRRLISAPIAICDLSTRNPNVLFELGIRQAFDKPVVLIQEEGTPPIFDISPLRYLEYSREMRYHEVVETQKRLSDSILETIEAHSDSGSVTSIVKLLALTDAARIPDLKGEKDTVSFDFLRAEMGQIRKMLDTTLGGGRSINRRDSLFVAEFERINNSVERIMSYGGKLPLTTRIEGITTAMEDLDRLLQTTESRAEQSILRNLMHRAEGLRRKLIIESEEIPF